MCGRGDDPTQYDLPRRCSTPGCERDARPGWATCRTCADALLTQNARKPEWLRRGVPAKDMTGAVS